MAGDETPATREEVARRGPFWEVVEGRAAPPPAAKFLGWQLVEVDPDAGTIEISFDATGQMTNPVGDVQGGLLAAMLDDTLGPALVATLPPDQFAPTLDLHVQFLRPARPGRITGRGHVRSRGRSIAFLAGELVDDAGAVLAVASATARIRTQADAPAPSYGG
ncbi:MAG: PaaI family thioesterase [Acidimicrobiales bacterium]